MRGGMDGKMVIHPGSREIRAKLCREFVEIPWLAARDTYGNFSGMIVTGTYFDGSIVLDQPLAVANGEHLSLVVDEDDRCADGNKWPETKAEVETWCRRIVELPALFDDEVERRAFETRIQDMRREQVPSLSGRGDRVAALFRE